MKDRVSWDAATAGQRRAAALIIGDELQQRGFRFQFDRLNGDVAIFRDADQLEWAFVPAGTVSPWGARESELLLDALEVVEGWKDDDRLPRSLDSIRPYGMTGFTPESMFALQGDVRPMLVLAKPLESDAPRVEAFVAREAFRYQPPFGKSPGPLIVRAPFVAALLEPRGWRLPTSLESAWITGGRRGSIFPWGDRIPEAFTAMGPEGDGLLMQSHWVQNGAALGLHGGGSSSAPWQDCGEWALFITRAIELPITGKDFGHAVLPVIDV